MAKQVRLCLLSCFNKDHRSGSHSAILPVTQVTVQNVGVLGDNVKIQKDKNKLSVTTEVQMSKR